MTTTIKDVLNAIAMGVGESDFSGKVVGNEVFVKDMDDNAFIVTVREKKRIFQEEKPKPEPHLFVVQEGSNVRAVDIYDEPSTDYEEKRDYAKDDEQEANPE